MITDVQLAIFANALGVTLFLLVVLYHYVSVNNKKDWYWNGEYWCNSAGWGEMIGECIELTVAWKAGKRGGGGGGGTGGRNCLEIHIFPAYFEGERGFSRFLFGGGEGWGKYSQVMCGFLLAELYTTTTVAVNSNWNTLTIQLFLTGIVLQ